MPDTAAKPDYEGDHALAAALKRCGARLDVSAVRRLVAGVVAAPAGEDEDAWMALVGGALTPATKAQLRALRAETAARAAAAAGKASTSAERVARLRAELARRGLDGFVVARGDEH